MVALVVSSCTCSGQQLCVILCRWMSGIFALVHPMAKHLGNCRLRIKVLLELQPADAPSEAIASSPAYWQVSSTFAGLPAPVSAPATAAASAATATTAVAANPGRVAGVEVAQGSSPPSAAIIDSSKADHSAADLGGGGRGDAGQLANPVHGDRDCGSSSDKHGPVGSMPDSPFRFQFAAGEEDDGSPLCSPRAAANRAAEQSATEKTLTLHGRTPSPSAATVNAEVSPQHPHSRTVLDFLSMLDTHEIAEPSGACDVAAVQAMQKSRARGTQGRYTAEVMRVEAPGPAVAARAEPVRRSSALAKAAGQVSRSMGSVTDALRAGTAGMGRLQEAKDVRMCIEAALHLDLPTHPAGEKTVECKLTSKKHT